MPHLPLRRKQRKDKPLPYDIESDMMAINIPGQIVEQEFMSEDYHGICILMSERFVSGLGLPYNYQTYMALQECPILKLQQGQMDAMLTYCAMVRKLFKVHHPNKVEVIKHLTCAFLYGMGYYFHRLMASRKLTKEEILMQKFSMEVEQNYRKERKVLFLCRFTAPVCRIFIHNHKKMQRKSAAEWIDDYVILEAKALLRSTNLTIQQISYELNFPSQSFFGKYFKRLTGMSPKEYKENRYTERKKPSKMPDFLLTFPPPRGRSIAFRTLRSSGYGERNDIADVLHSGDEQNQTLRNPNRNHYADMFRNDGCRDTTTCPSSGYSAPRYGPSTCHSSLHARNHR